MSERRQSAGADKVEEIARRIRQGEGTAAAAGGPGREGQGGAKDPAAEAERAAAAARVAAAQEQQRAAQERQRADSEAQAERALRAAARRQERAERRAERKKGRAPGFGGWLTAVVSLSVAVLALGAVLAVGYFDLDAAQAELAGGYRRAAYELAERVEALDTDLAKAQVAEGAALQRALTDVVVQCELAARDLESFPAEGQASAPLSAFFGHAGRRARALSGKLAAGQALSAEEEGEVAALYARVQQMRAAMPKLLEPCANGAFRADDAAFAEGFAALGRIAGEGMPEVMRRPAPAERTSSEKAEEQGEDMGEAAVAARVGELFSAYGCRDVSVAGKTGRGMYHVEFADAEGRAYAALLTAQGQLAFLDGHEECARTRFGREACIEAAQTFLEHCGYADMQAVWASEGGSECRIEFVPVQEGVLLYPDRVAVKVCRGRGEVTGLDARAYLQRHRARSLPAPLVPMARVEENAARKMQLSDVRAALIPAGGEERLCWEVCGSRGGRLYYAYVDASTGETLAVRTPCADGRLH